MHREILVPTRVTNKVDHIVTVKTATRLPAVESSIESTEWLSAPENITVSVVVPTLNEAANLEHVLPKIPHWVLEVIVVDGGSTDGTVKRAQELRDDVVIIEDLTPGKGHALQRGFRAARGEAIVMIDADGSMDPSEIRAFISTLVEGAEFAKGSRFIDGGGTVDMEWYRRAGNSVLTRMVRLAFGGRYTDLCYGFNAFWKCSIDKLELDAPGFEIETLMNVRALTAGLNVVEVPSFESDRINGQSNLNTVTDGFRVLRTIVAERCRPLGSLNVIDLAEASV